MKYNYLKLFICGIVLTMVITFSGGIIAFADDELLPFEDEVHINYIPPFVRVSNALPAPTHYYTWTMPEGIIVYSNSTTCDDASEMATFYADFTC